MAVMRGKSHVVAACALGLACACGTGDTRVDPGDLELRDLLGVSPAVAGGWDRPQRESARRVLFDALELGGDAIRSEAVVADQTGDRIARSLATVDARRFADGAAALGFVRVVIDGSELTGAARPAPTVIAVAEGRAPAAAIALELDERWGPLSTRGRDVLSALAVDAGHAISTDRVVVMPAPRLSVVASYTPGAGVRAAHLLVNPVLIAAIVPEASELVVVVNQAVARDDRSGHGDEPARLASPGSGAVAAGNPYSFYGSVAECAYAQRTRCEACLPSGTCKPVTTSDGTTECMRLAENDGRGYFLLCINLSLAITSVDDCTASVASTCGRDTDAASDLGQLENNARYLDDTSCGDALDVCLAKIYGAPKTPFPGIVDGGVDPPPGPPRRTDVSCGDACSGDNNANCEFSPSCDCSGPSCGNSLSCDSTCSSSNSQSGCGDNCDSCSSDTGGGGGGGGGGGSCGGGGDGGGGGGSCGGGGDGGGGGGSCGGGGDGGGGGGGCGDCGGGGGCGDCGGGGCGGGDCGGGGGDCGGGDCGGGGSCQTTRKAPNAAVALVLSLSWALLPVPLAAVLRRRARKRRQARAGDDRVADEEVTR
jgi:hypothetical protein